MIINSSVCYYQLMLVTLMRHDTRQLPNQFLMTYAPWVSQSITLCFVNSITPTNPFYDKSINRRYLTTSTTWKKKGYIRLTTSHPLKLKKITLTKETFTIRIRTLTKY